jgi:hypothetical protein
VSLITAEVVDFAKAMSEPPSPHLAEKQQPLKDPTPLVSVPPLPEKNLGTLRGGRWPFTYDPVYGLPVVNDVASYGEVLRGIREGRIQELLWFKMPEGSTNFIDGRCLVRYYSGRVQQSVLPPEDLRLGEAINAHGVKRTILPQEPRWVGVWGGLS